MNEQVLTIITSAAFAIGRERQAGLAQVAGDDLGVDQVLRAAERHDAHLQPGGGRNRERAHGVCDSTVKVSGSESSLCGP